MPVYLLLDLTTLLPPILGLILSRQYWGWKHFTNSLLAITPVAFFFILWDIAAVQNNVWSFNPQYVLPFEFLLLPIEELLFFFCIPLACLFIYETCAHIFSEKKLPFLKHILSVLAFCMLSIAVFYWKLEYSRGVFLASCLTFLLLRQEFSLLGSSKHYWLFLGFTYIPKLVINGLLTSLPVVLYNSSTFSGIRLGTIPLEDFFYSFVLLTWCLFIYKKFLRQVKGK